jgi:hypothetical protein
MRSTARNWELKQTPGSEKYSPVKNLWTITNEDKGRLINKGATFQGAYLYASRYEKINVIRGGVKVPHVCTSHTVAQLKKLLGQRAYTHYPRLNPLV